MNRLSTDKQADILHLMMERQGPRALSRTARGNSKGSRKGVSINTVYKLLEDAGDAAIEFLDKRMKHIPCRFVEADEAYCIVGKNPRTVRFEKSKVPGIGAVWLWVAIDRDSKLILSWHLGDRKSADADQFIADLAARLANRVQITTDFLGRYPESIERAFGVEVDYARVKQRSHAEEEKRTKLELLGLPYKAPVLTEAERRKRKEEDKPVAVFGNPDLSQATTNHIEAFWTQARKDISRMTRRTTLISKKIENLRRAFALYVFHHNFVKVHTAHGTTPAIFAGIEDTRWTWDYFADLVNEFRERRPKKLVPPKPRRQTPDVIHLPDESGNAETMPFCVLQTIVGRRYVKLHRTTCPHLRIGTGREGVGAATRKLFCETADEARKLAAALPTDDVTECKYCFGSVNSRGYLDPSKRKGPWSR